MMKRISKPAMKIGNAARKAVQREFKNMAGSNPLTREGYALVEQLVKKQTRKKKKGGREKGGASIEVLAPSAKGSVQVSGQMSSNGFDTRPVSGTETFISVYRPDQQDYDAGGIFDISANSAGFYNLAREAANYQFYRFSKMSITYEPVCSTGTQGQIIFGTLADPTDPQPESLESARAVKNSVSTPVWQRVKLTVPCDKTDRYVDGDISSSSDIRFQIFKRMFLGSTSVNTGQSTGLFTVEYTCILSKRKPSTTQIGQLEINVLDKPFSLLFANVPSNNYYKVAPSGLITVNTSGRFRAQIALRSSTDQVLPNVTITNGGVIVPSSLLTSMSGYSQTTDTNITMLLASVGFVLRTRGAIIDCSALLSLVGTGSFMLSIEPDNSRIST